MKRFGKESQYFAWGLTAFCVLAGSILFYLLLGHLGDVISAVKSVLRLLTPFFWGFAIAYILLPMSRYFEYKVYALIGGKLTKRTLPKGGAPRVLAIATAITIAIAAISVFLWLIIPTVYSSLENILGNYNTYINTLVSLIQRWFADFPEIADRLLEMIKNLSGTVVNWISNEFLPQVGSFITNVTTGVYLVFKFVLNIAIGFVVACYLLYNREHFSATAKKLLYSVFGVVRSEQIQNVIRFADDAFMGFISGKVLDSTIIGIITFVCCYILRMPYAAFISVIVGITNVIPVFGPFIGAIPCTLIILMVEPKKALIFVILILIIQQVDGNIIGPKILGNRVGLNGFWVMFAIIVCGGLFGVVGMIIGVPLFVVLRAGYNYLVDSGLKKRGLSTQTSQYMNMERMDPETGIPIPREGRRQRARKKKKTDSAESGKK